MKLVVIGVVALLVLGGGGAAGYFYFMQPAEAALVEGEAADGKDHADSGDGHGKKDAGGDGHGDGHASFVELDPLILPIIDGSGVNQVVSLVVALEVSGEEGIQLIEAMAPKLKDAYIQDMYGVLSHHAALKGGVIQVGMIKARLNKVNTKVLGEDVVHDVLLQVVQQRPI